MHARKLLWYRSIGSQARILACCRLAIAVLHGLARHTDVAARIEWLIVSALAYMVLEFCDIGIREGSYRELGMGLRTPIDFFCFMEM